MFSRILHKFFPDTLEVATGSYRCIFYITNASMRHSITIPSNTRNRTIIFLQRRSLVTSPLLLKGHSKWQNIKATKAKKDDERSRRITFYLNMLRSALRADDTDPKNNKRIADLERNYIKESLPLDTFNKFIQSFKDKPDISVTYQLRGPGNSYFIVKLEAESKARAQGAIAKILKKVPEFQLTDNLIGSSFEEKGVIVVDSITKQSKKLSLGEMEEIGIELECEDVQLIDQDGDEGEKFELICSTMDLYKTENQLNARDFKILSAEAQMLTTGDRVRLDSVAAASVERLYELIGDNEYVKQVFDNLEQDNSDSASDKRLQNNRE